MFILPLPSPTSSKCLSEGHPAGHLPVSCSPRCAQARARGEVGDACRVDLSESSRGAEPEGCKRWEKQSCLVLSGCPHTQGHRRTYSSTKCSAGLRTLFQDALGRLVRLGSSSGNVFFPLVEQLLLVHVAAGPALSFPQQGQGNGARL